MSWKEKAKKLYQKVAYEVMKYGAPLLMMLPSFGKAGPMSDSMTEDGSSQKKGNKYENVISASQTGANILSERMVYNPDAYLDIRSLDENKIAQALSEMSFGDVLAKKLITEKEIKNYPFTAEDFKQMAPGELGRKLEKVFASKHLGRPRGDCLTGVRSAVAKAWNYDIWTHSGRACEWPERVAESDMPVVFLGEVNVKEVNGKLQDYGNIHREDLKFVQYALVGIDGNRSKSANAQPAGHITFVRPVYDESGKLLKSDGLCDGREDFTKVVDQKIGGGQRRYGHKAVVMVPNDSKISEGLAQYITEKVMERYSNAVDVCKLLEAEENTLEKYLKPAYEQVLPGYVASVQARAPRRQTAEKSAAPVLKSAAERVETARARLHSSSSEIARKENRRQENNTYARMVQSRLSRGEHS